MADKLSNEMWFPLPTMNYSGTSLLRSTTGLGKSDLNVEVTLLQGVICTVEYKLGLSQGVCRFPTSEVTVMLGAHLPTNADETV